MRPSSFARGLPPKLLFFISLIWSCTLLDPPLSFGSPRAEDHRRGSPSGAAQEVLRDTLLLVSAVCFPESYDWQRDSAFGNVACTLRLFRGPEEVLSIPAGPGTTVSASPDGHHIIDGNLYTVYTDPGGTYIGRNGTPLAHWKEKEYIVGILPSGNDIFTLGLCQGGGLAFRCNGREQFQDADGVPFGGFGADTYGTGGALYFDSGDVCFSYLHGGREAIFVRGGEQDGQPFSPPESTILDARYINGSRCSVYNQENATTLYRNGSYRTTNGLKFIDAGLIELEGRLFCAGRCLDTHTRDEYLLVWNERLSYRFHGMPVHLYFYGPYCIPLHLDEHQDCRFFGKGCANALDANIAVALTPRDGSSPFVLYNGARHEYPVHGFLSGVGFKLPEEPC